MKYLVLLLLVAFTTNARLFRRYRRTADNEYKMCAEELLDKCNQTAAEEIKSSAKIVCDSERDSLLVGCLLDSNRRGKMNSVPTVTFNNGEKVPIFGLGTWQSQPGEVTQAVKDAIDMGYRHFDCAHVYQNEKEIGQAIAEKIAEGVVKREDLFITSKLWNTFHKPEMVEEGIKRTLTDLGLTYLDLYLIHWPMAFKEGDLLYPRGPNGIEFSDCDYVDTWLAMEEVYKKGLAKSIGISNFNKKQIERLLEHATVVPVTNQVECHPYLNQKALIEFCASKNITITAYSPLGSPNRPWVTKDAPKLLEDLKLKGIAKKFKKSSAQIILRYSVQRGLITIPKSTNKARISENFEIFNFELSADDMATIDSLNIDYRAVPFNDAKAHKYYPFTDEY